MAASRRRSRLTPDQAVIAVLVTAMNANQHVSAQEAARAHHAIWSMRRFRRKDGETVGRLIEIVRDRIERDGEAAVLEEAARTMPARLRSCAFAVAVDLVLADAALERAERRFLGRLAGALGLRPALAREIVKVMIIKNAA